MAPGKEDETKKQDVWKSLLESVAEKTANKPLAQRTLLILGDEGSGKSSLVSRLQGKKHNPQEHPIGTGLEYTYLNVKEEESDDIVGRLGVYTLDGNEQHSKLLSFVLNKDTADSVVCMIVADMTKPWAIPSSFQKWIRVLEQHLEEEIGDNWPRPDMKAALKRHIVRYEPPLPDSVKGQEEEDGGEAAAVAGQSSAAADEDDSTATLPEGVLETNLGIPIILVVAKSDHHTVLEQAHDYRQEQFDFIQITLRKMAIQYGAALVYNGKDDTNTETLYRYVLHRCYGAPRFPFNENEDISSRDALFVPTGWDNMTHIREMYDDLKTISPEAEYTDVIQEPAVAQNPPTIQEAMDEQEFLKEQELILSRFKGDKIAAGAMRQGASPATTRAAARKEAAAVGQGARPRAAGNAAAGGGEASKQGADGNTEVLANFFNSLLKKKP